MCSKYTLVRFIAIGLAVVPACLAVTMCALGATPQFFRHQRLPLGSPDGVVTSADAVFVASGAAGRVYKFDLSGNLLTWIDIHGRPISIAQSGESITVHYSGRTWALEDPAFRARDPHGLVASVERNWLGHPALVVRRAEGTTRAALQPWYLTVVQGPYPGAVWPPAVIALLLVERWACYRGRRLGRKRSASADEHPP